jgi:hypothetical protein
VVETEYQSSPSALLSRATMRAHRGSSATDREIGFEVVQEATLIFISFMLPERPLSDHRRTWLMIPPDFRFAAPRRTSWKTNEARTVRAGLIRVNTAIGGITQP